MPADVASGRPPPGAGRADARSPIDLRVMYDGAGPVHWTGDEFGVQDQTGALHAGKTAGSVVIFDLQVEVGGAEALPNFTGRWTHGPKTARFLYLGWRNRDGALAQRLKLPLGTIAWDDIRCAREGGQPLTGRVIDHHPRATTTGANVGGTRPVDWHVGRPPL